MGSNKLKTEVAGMKERRKETEKQMYLKLGLK